MNYTKIEKASKILKKIKGLDKEIIAIEKYAMIVADNNVNPSIKISIDKVNKPSKEKESVLDEDGSLKTGDIGYNSIKSWMIDLKFSNNNSDKEDELKESLIFDLKETEVLTILGIAIRNRIKLRDQLISNLDLL